MKKYIVYPLGVEFREEKGNSTTIKCRTINILIREKDVEDFERMFLKEVK